MKCDSRSNGINIVDELALLTFLNNKNDNIGFTHWAAQIGNTNQEQRNTNVNF